MGSIRVPLETVREVAKQFKQKSNESATMASQLQSAVNGMESQWEGMAKQRFYSDFTQWHQQMQKYAELLNNIGAELDKIALTIEATDNNLAGR